MSQSDKHDERHLEVIQAVRACAMRPGGRGELGLSQLLLVCDLAEAMCEHRSLRKKIDDHLSGAPRSSIGPFTFKLAEAREYLSKMEAVIAATPPSAFKGWASGEDAPYALCREVEKFITSLGEINVLAPVSAIAPKVRVTHSHYSPTMQGERFDLYLGETFLGQFGPEVTPLANAIGKALGQYVTSDDTGAKGG